MTSPFSARLSFVDAIEHATAFRRWDAIFGYYRHANEEILKGSDPNHWALDPYEVRWEGVMSPIEAKAWSDIRVNGGVVFYPQYPVRNRYVDFGNPVLRLALECDGAEFHQDRKREQARDAELRDLGWSVIHVSGAECARTLIGLDEMLEELDCPLNDLLASPQYRAQAERWFMETSEGIVEAIRLKYFERISEEHPLWRFVEPTIRAHSGVLVGQ